MVLFTQQGATRGRPKKGCGENFDSRYQRHHKVITPVNRITTESPEEDGVDSSNFDERLSIAGAIIVVGITGAGADDQSEL